MDLPNKAELERHRRLKGFFRRWHVANGRSYPWREPGVSGFEILVAEMLLRQTRAGSVVPIWTELLKRYPDSHSLASADSEDLIGLIRPLGFGHQRASALTQMARHLVQTHQGRVPRTVEGLLAIPHVGLYAAHAVLCFAFRKRMPIVDVNVLRVVSRIYGIDLGSDNRRSPEAWKIAWAILPAYKFRQHNFGLLDFGAQICTARQPKHDVCPLRSICAFVKK